MRYLFLYLTLIIPCQLHAQYTLSDSNFLAGFRTETLSFNQLRLGKIRHWQLIAGRPTLTEKRHTEEEAERYYQYLDSLYKELDDSLDNVKFICESIADVDFYKCLQANRKRKDRYDYCNQLNRDADSICEMKYFVDQYNLDKSRDDLEWKFRYEAKYTITSSFSSTNKIERVVKRKVKDFKISGFGTWCPPDGCSWYILALNKGRLDTLNSIESMTRLFGPIDQLEEAALLVTATAFGESIGYPVNPITVQYRKVGDVFYFIKKLRLSDCPITHYNCLISVIKNGKVEIIDKVMVGESGGCI